MGAELRLLYACPQVKSFGEEKAAKPVLVMDVGAGQ